MNLRQALQYIQPLPQASSRVIGLLFLKKFSTDPAYFRDIVKHSEKINLFKSYDFFLAHGRAKIQTGKIQEGL